MRCRSGNKGCYRSGKLAFHCERIFAGLGLNDEQKRRLASIQLQGATLDRWNGATTGVPEEELIWVEFRRRFKERFLSEIAKSALLRKFMDLVQARC